jgi:hypothetical protein
MPNWVYNSLYVSGDATALSTMKAQLNKPFTLEHDSWDVEKGEMVRKPVSYSNPVFAFWNIIQPSDLEAYAGQGDMSLPLAEKLMFQGNNWYDWNVRNWGTKWDVAVHDEEKYPDTEILEESESDISYKFNTAWSPPESAIVCLSMQYPTLSFELEFEEEGGWGGTVIYSSGEGTITEEYQSKCRNCDEQDCTPYCEDCDSEVCTKCGYNATEECKTHKALLV